MKKCKECGKTLRRVYRFNPDGTIQKFYRCHTCWWDSRPTRTNIKDIYKDKEFIRKEENGVQRIYHNNKRTKTTQ